MSDLSCDALIVGGSTGGVAAAMSATKSGLNVVLIEETGWLGGQLTTQGVCTPDEQSHIETFGASQSYADFRKAIRAHYASKYMLSPEAEKSETLNPGNCWVSRLSYEPKAGVEVLRQMLKPLEESGRLTILYHTKAISCEMNDTEIVAVQAKQSSPTPNPQRLTPNTQNQAPNAQHSTPIAHRISAKFFLDATDLGELLPMCGIEGVDWILGAESRSQTGEPDAPEESKPNWVQPFTFPFALEWSPATVATNLIEPPTDYEELKRLQNYHIKHGAITGLFKGRAAWWSYRRILATSNFRDARIPNDVAMINTAGNDYYGGNVIGADAGSEAQIEETLRRARRVSLGYVHWLQTECPREEEFSANGTNAPNSNPLNSANSELKFGYPEFRLRTDLFDTSDGCSILPYIRESRRILSRRTILEQEIVVKDFQGVVCRGERARAEFMPDSVGVGHYALDIHPNGHGEPNHYVATRPFQIPLGALIPIRLTNLLPACKNLGTTHLTNGAYRLHPIEWNIGEAAGRLAAFCHRRNLTPSQVYVNQAALSNFQNELLSEGIPLNWYIDVPIGHSAFGAVQSLASKGLQIGSESELLFRPEESFASEDWESWRQALNLPQANFPEKTRSEAAILIIRELDAQGG